MFGTSGVRGPFGETVTADLALAVGRALAVDGAERVVVGRDPRTTGPLLADALSAGLREYGADVVDLGVAATPTIARSVGWRDADAGVAITASHNPPEDNGIKLWTPSGMAFGEERRERIAATVEAGFEDEPTAAWDAVGTERQWDEAADRHRRAIVDSIADAAREEAGVPGDADGDAADEPALAIDLDVVVDVGNGAGAVTAPALRELGCSVETLNADPDGRFPSRPSEPTAEHCTSLCAQVAGTDADLGIAHDGDADRMLAVDEDGQFLEGDALLALFARSAVERAVVGADSAGDASGGPGDDTSGRSGSDASGGPGSETGDGPRVAVPINTSLVVDEAVEAAGGSVVRTRVGDVFVAERAREDDVVFGGEPSGAWIWPDQTLAPDGPLAACRLATVVAGAGSLSALLEDLGAGEFPIRRESHECEDKRRVVETVANLASDRYGDANQIDGVRVETDDGWFLVRASGTQPLVRLTAQARSEDGADDLIAEARSLFEDARAGRS